jgi:general secretion pathway protein A
MYKAFFGLDENPFNLTPDPRYLYLSSQHQEALDHLLFGINERKGFITITGGIGTGKTTLCRALLGHLDSKTKTALIFNSSISEMELLKGILQEFGLDVSRGEETRKAYIDTLNQFLLDNFSRGENTVLIIDEAQNLSPQVLEQIRMLSNLETEREKLIQIVLIGQSELKSLLSAPHLRQLNERITVRYDLKPLESKDLRGYIEHRLIIAGGKGNPRFSSGAIKKLFQYSGGNPRRINAVCDRALLLGYVRDKTIITRNMVHRAIKDIRGDTQTQRKLIPNTMIRLASMTILVLILVIAAGFAGLNLQDEILNVLNRKSEQDDLKADVVVKKRITIEQPSLFLDERSSLAGLLSLYEPEWNYDQNGQQDQLILCSLVMAPEYYLMLRKPFRVNVRRATNATNNDRKFLLTQRITSNGAIVIDAEGLERSIDRGFLMSHWGGKISWIYRRSSKDTILTSGRKGDDILTVQRKLREIGYQVDLNGHFDENMRHEVIKFQNDFNLTADGIVGPKTYALLFMMTGENEYH